MKKFVLLCVLPLAGCLAPPPPEPSPELIAIANACQQGNLEACAFLENLRQQERQRLASIPPPQIGGYVQPFPTMTGTRPQAMCVNNFGQIVPCRY